MLKRLRKSKFNGGFCIPGHFSYFRGAYIQHATIEESQMSTRCLNEVYQMADLFLMLIYKEKLQVTFEKLLEWLKCLTIVTVKVHILYILWYRQVQMFAGYFNSILHELNCIHLLLSSPLLNRWLDPSDNLSLLWKVSKINNQKKQTFLRFLCSPLVVTGVSKHN